MSAAPAQALVDDFPGRPSRVLVADDEASTGYRGRLLQHAIDLSDASVMVAHASLLPRLREIETAQLRDVDVVGEGPAAIGELTLHGREELHSSDRAETSRPVEPWDANFIMLTSGTTGPSKAVICTYIQTWCGGAMGMDYFDADDRVMANLPLLHIGGAGAVMDRGPRAAPAYSSTGSSPRPSGTPSAASRSAGAASSAR